MPVAGSIRRDGIIELLKKTGQPLSGAYLAEHFHVSRQVIVQDIALLRAKDYNIMSTNRGYYLEQLSEAIRIFHVTHSDEEIENELNLIVDQGATAVDVFVEHPVYGELRVPLNVSSRREVKAFLESIKDGKASPLKNLTANGHYHTVEAENELVLDDVEKELRENHFLVE